MNSLLKQLKKRRLTLGLKQSDMMFRVGVSRQQYQRLESRGNPRLDTLELIAKGLNSELMLIPQEKLQAVLAVLERDPSVINGEPSRPRSPMDDSDGNDLSADPWKNLLGED